MQVSLEKAKYPDLVKYAQTQGLDVTYGGAKQDEIIAMIRNAFPDVESIEVADNVSPIAKASGEKTTHYRDDPKVTVNIASDPLNGGTRHFPITVGPDLILVKRDTDVEIPYRFYLVLENAIETVLAQESNPVTGKLVTTSSEQNAVRFTVKRLPPQDEIDAFHARTRDVGRSRKKAA